MPFLETLIDPRVAKEFGPSEQDRAAARSNAFIQAGLGMIGSRGGLMNAISQGGLLGFDSYNRSLENAQRAKAYQFQTGLELSKLAKQQDQERAIAEAIAKESPEIQQAVRMGVPYQEIWKRRNPEDQFKVVGGSMVKVSGGDVHPVYQAPEKLPEWATKDANGNRIVDPAYLDMRKSIAAAGRSNSVTYNAPISGVDASGNPVFFQPTKDGSPPVIVPGVRPTPTEKNAPMGYRFTESGDLMPIPGGPADVKAQAAAQQKLVGASDVDLAIGTLRDAYDRLEKGGGITSTKNGSVSNFGAAVSSSGIGQTAGKMFGTDNQSARNDIAMTRPALLAALMKATGMSAKQMDSNAELKMWMTTATDPTLDVESNRRALDNIERKYLSGAQAGNDQPRKVRRYNPQTGRIE